MNQPDTANTRCASGHLFRLRSCPDCLALIRKNSAACTRCKRGAEACGYCEGIEERDWEAICDCGLYDFGDHLFDCEARAAFKYVVAGDYAQAEVPRV